MASSSSVLRAAWSVGVVAGVVVLSMGASARERNPLLGVGGASGATGPRRANEGTYLLRRAPDGGYTYNALTFEARIAPDGHVTFNDLHGSAGATLLGLPLFGAPDRSGDRPSLQRAIADWMRPDPNRAIPFALPEHTEAADPLLALPVDLRRPRGPMLIGVSGTFDLTDELMLRTGHGWYRFEKAKFLSATFDFRLKLAIAEQRRLLLVAAGELPARLTALWADDRYAPREKRRILFLLWLEVDQGDDAGRAIARIIETWIRERLPAGSVSAYSADELSAYQAQARAAKRVFDPYRSAPSSGDVSGQGP